MVTKENHQSCSCNCSMEEEPRPAWVLDERLTSSGKILVVKTELTSQDVLDGWKARWNIGRMNYKIPPGLYAVGKPDSASPVLATANYKMTFDRLRKELSGRDLWLLVLDTKGINVWCAAGKGTFGTDELIGQIKKAKLSRLLLHRSIILPQLGAPGVSGFRVTEETGFRVTYGPVRASDISRFLDAGMKASPEMRRVTFGLRDRMALAPVELVSALKLVPFIAAFLLLVLAIEGRIDGQAYALSFVSFLAALLAGAIVFPALLPWLPGRAFSIRGWILGALVAAGASLFQGADALHWIVNLLWLSPLTAHLALRFTGSTTFTSLSGVEKEVKYFYPVALVSLLAGMAMTIAHPF